MVKFLFIALEGMRGWLYVHPAVGASVFRGSPRTAEDAVLAVDNGIPVGD